MSDPILNIFELASRQKLRFDTPFHSGLTVEQLWDLPLKSQRTNASDLDGAGKEVMRTLREGTEESLVSDVPDRKQKELELKLDVLKYIIAAKKAEQAAVVQSAANATERAKLLEIKSIKQAAKLEALSDDEIDARLRALGG